MQMLLFWAMCVGFTGVRMEKSRASVKLCEASVGVDRSDVTVTFRLNLWPQEQTEAKRDTTRWEKVNIIKYGCNRQDCKGNTERG